VFIKWFKTACKGNSKTCKQNRADMLQNKKEVVHNISGGSGGTSAQVSVGSECESGQYVSHDMPLRQLTWPPLRTRATMKLPCVSPCHGTSVHRQHFTGKHDCGCCCCCYCTSRCCEGISTHTRDVALLYHYYAAVAAAGPAPFCMRSTVTERSHTHPQISTHAHRSALT
jgi:hypothetical protein